MKAFLCENRKSKSAGLLEAEKLKVLVWILEAQEVKVLVWMLVAETVFSYLKPINESDSC